MDAAKLAHKPATTQRPLIEAIRVRWSPIAFDPGRAIEPEVVATILEAARWAPSSYNDQPWRYLLFDRNDPARARAEACLMAGNAWARHAGLLILSVACKISDRTSLPNRFALHDTGMASMSLVLQAAAHGLISHQMGGYDREQARSEFAIPDRFELASMIAVGYPGDPAMLDSQGRERQASMRSRKDLAQIAFTGSWETAYPICA